MKSLDVRPVKWIDEVLQIALTHMPTPLSDEKAAELVKESAAESAGKSKPIQTH
jgi:ATP-dependent Lon protease